VHEVRQAARFFFETFSASVCQTLQNLHVEEDEIMKDKPQHVPEKNYLQRLSPSLKIYAGLILLMVVIKLFFELNPVAFRLSDQSAAFAWPTIAGVAIMGLVGIAMSRKIGIPEIWDEKISNHQRFLIPLLAGLVYGAITVAPEILGISGALHPLAVSSGVHVEFPLSIPFYAYGAIFLEVLLRLFALSFLVWLLSYAVLRNRWRTAIFWIADIAVALYEPMPYLMEDIQTAAGPPQIISAIMTTILGPLFLANVFSGYLFKKYGFLASLVMRLSFYLVWHIIYGGLT
jgi:hypothetical protein